MKTGTTGAPVRREITASTGAVLVEEDADQPAAPEGFKDLPQPPLLRDELDSTAPPQPLGKPVEQRRVEGPDHDGQLERGERMRRCEQLPVAEVRAQQ